MTDKTIRKAFAELAEMQVQQLELLRLAIKASSANVDRLTRCVAILVNLVDDEWAGNHAELQDLKAILTDRGVRNAARQVDSVFIHQLHQHAALLAAYKAKLEAMPDDG
jgi:hypothetical protein